MTQQQYNFKSRVERERESKLVQNYREIGIAAILAASATRRKSEPKPTALTIANGNHRD